MTPANPHDRLAAFFAGPKAENGEFFAHTLQRIVSDYHAWRRNHFPEDGIVVDSALRRANEHCFDDFDDKLTELLARLKADFPFHSPRYAAHMLAEQTLPSIAAYFAAMLYNPNNVSTESAPVTVRLELEAAGMIARMLGYGADAWAHLTSGGTLANIEALWVARAVKYLPLALADARRSIDPQEPELNPSRIRALLNQSPEQSLLQFHALFSGITRGRKLAPNSALQLDAAFHHSRFNTAFGGIASVCAAVGSTPVLIVPETHHYCFDKALDLLGFGQHAKMPVKVDHDFRMRIDDLERTLDLVERQGRHILAVVAVVGTTEEGAVDPVDRILDLRARRQAQGREAFWVHVDGAYGGYLRTLTIPNRAGLGQPTSQVKIGARVRDLPLTLPVHSVCDALERLGECESITIDPHKLGYIPYPAGCICFRRDLVKPLVRQTAPYIAEATPSGVDTDRAGDSIGMYILEGSKPGAAAAAVWLSHTLIPLDASGHGALVQETIRNACELHALLEAFPSLNCPEQAAVRGGPPTNSSGGIGVRAVCLCPPGSNIVCFAFRPAEGNASLEHINAANRRVYERFTVSDARRVYEQRFYVSRTVLSPAQYSADTVSFFLDRMGIDAAHYRQRGVFLLRSVLMNPWYSHAKRRGRYFLSELTADLYQVAATEFA